MAKNPNKKVAPKDEPMNGAMKFFLAGCVAELYLLILRRFYINADSELTRIAWYDHYLWTLAGIGAGVLAVGVIAALVLRGSAKKQKSAWILAAAGAFVGAATALVRLNMATLSFMTIVVPVIMLLGILWALYDRECALALTVLGASLFVLWGVRRYGSSMYVGTTVKICVVIYLVLLAALAVLTKNGKLNKLLPPKADKLPVYAACGLSAEPAHRRHTPPSHRRRPPPESTDSGHTMQNAPHRNPRSHKNGGGSADTAPPHSPPERISSHRSSARLFRQPSCSDFLPSIKTSRVIFPKIAGKSRRHTFTV